jgi:hypothetical protein
MTPCNQQGVPLRVRLYAVVLACSKAEHSEAVRQYNWLDSKQARIGRSGKRINGLLDHPQSFCSTSLPIARAGLDHSAAVHRTPLNI